MTAKQQRTIEECNIALEADGIVATGYEIIETGEKIGGGTKNPK